MKKILALMLSTCLQHPRRNTHHPQPHPLLRSSSGMLPSELVLSEDLPVEFLAALLLSAPCFPRGLRLTFPAKARGNRKILVTFELLAKFGLAPQEEMRGEQCAVFLAPAHPQPPEPELDSPLEASFERSKILLRLRPPRPQRDR